MAGRALNDAEVAQEMKKMTEFIKQEALEKSREIQVKADEEHNIEKAKIVRQETIAIEAYYEKKMKQAEVARKIAQSNHINKCRLRVLQARDEQLQELMLEARQRLSTVSTSDFKYSQLLSNLILQGLLQLDEKQITIYCKKVDVKSVEAILPQVTQEFQKQLGFSCQVTLSTDKFLSEQSAGGVLLTAQDGKIMCNNTLESRLELAFEALLPAMRAMMFGFAPGRRFFD